MDSLEESTSTSNYILALNEHAESKAFEPINLRRQRAYAETFRKYWRPTARVGCKQTSRVAQHPSFTV